MPVPGDSVARSGLFISSPLVVVVITLCELYSESSGALHVVGVGVNRIGMIIWNNLEGSVSRMNGKDSICIHVSQTTTIQRLV